ncbi:MAG: contractile injection system tape measure protein [Bacteroides sp.]
MKIQKHSHMNHDYLATSQDESKHVPISNAGLALLSPWFPHLFYTLGWLNDERTNFKDTDSCVRAVFALQYLVGSAQNEFSREELVFNCILVGCPFTVSLPGELECSKAEKEVLDTLLQEIKAAWPKMRNTSIEEFQSSFIERSGYLEQKEEELLLTVGQRSYDLFLNSLPWTFGLIRFPWLETTIVVNWRSGNRPNW